MDYYCFKILCWQLTFGQLLTFQNLLSKRTSTFQIFRGSGSNARFRLGTLRAGVNSKSQLRTSRPGVNSDLATYQGLSWPKKFEAPSAPLNTPVLACNCSFRQQNMKNSPIVVIFSLSRLICSRSR